MTGDNFIMPTPNFLTINGGSGQIVTIGPDGTVTINKEGSAPEVARIFWEAVSMHHKTVIAERDRLKQRVEELESMFSEELEALNQERTHE